MNAIVHDPQIQRVLMRIRRDGILFSTDDILDVVEHPRWLRDGALHDWRRHVPPGVRDQWTDLSLLTRLCVFETAEMAAMEEVTGAAMVSGPST